MIEDILNNETFKDKKFNLLDDNEKHLYKMIIKKCKLAGNVNVRLDKLNSSEIDELKNRFNLVIGQIEAGNDNKDIKSEAKDLIQKMISKKLISNNAGINLLLKI